MNTLTWQENPRMAAMMDRISEMMEKPAPRPVPPEVWRNARSPIARFLLIMGVGFFVFDSATFFAFGMMNGVRGVLLAITLVLPLILVLFGLRSLLATRKVLSNGQLYKGKVNTVYPLPARINGRYFCGVKVEFDGPGGAKTRGTETIDNYSSEWFMDARDKGEDVDVIYSPNMMGKVVLPMKIALGSRFD